MAPSGWDCAGQGRVCPSRQAQHRQGWHLRRMSRSAHQMLLGSVCSSHTKHFHPALLKAASAQPLSGSPC